ncbi:sugar kinase [Treponema phagedenis]|uniref:Carbohydrate kinase, FGGY family protein n=1 Tax=Treponema phagedenis TaxID=162 RepID=A0A0B7GVZ8_TREPH|nr:FGGY-family carbohydrate kinase [Treponema phagedenis]NVP25175.1 sugar kinase [Treponema phagedenis]QEJ95966.1 sugar kinase [Treponema phagedenis]QEJ97289.1 sugar kinase [Treponema phagedenis]QEK00334.1 sugar kinase [Treponema phagedenis]QEK02517.1 sugar kinase [Treponema phagedenis]
MNSGIFTADIGTSSLKAAVINDEGALLQYKRIYFPEPVTAESWFTSLIRAFDVMSQKNTIEAICISGNGPSFVAVSNTKKKKDFLLLWNEKAPRDFSTPPSIFLPRALFFKECYPHIFQSARYLLSGPEYLIYKLTGEAVTVLPEQRYTAAYWDDKRLAALDLAPELFPPFVMAGTKVGTWKGIPVICSVPDFLAALIGTDTLEAGKACDRAGSSEGLNICIQERPENARGLRFLPSIISDLWNISYLIPDSGSKFATYLQSTGFGKRNFYSCMQAISKLEISLDNSYPNTKIGEGKMLVETIGFEIRKGLDLLESVSGYKPVYAVSGGQAQDRIWLQIKADITGRSFALPFIHDSELTGNAALAYTALGKYPDLGTAAAKLCKIKRIYTPNPEHYETYTRKFNKSLAFEC